jgi:hypothetical protein
MPWSAAGVTAAGGAGEVVIGGELIGDSEGDRKLLLSHGPHEPSRARRGSGESARATRGYLRLILTRRQQAPIARKEFLAFLLSSSFDHAHQPATPALKSWPYGQDVNVTVPLL